MTSMLCQKTNSGSILPINKDLYNFLVLENTTSNVNSNENFKQLDSEFLKKFPKTKVNEEKNIKTHLDQGKTRFIEA